jgi:UDP-N-acetyl-D-mannosaminuronate dehydrogenase
MADKDHVIVVGMGEIGQPLFRILSKNFSCMQVDLVPVEPRGQCSVLHICYPFQIPDFVDTTARYIEKYQPALTIINSTVVPGTTAKVSQAAGAKVAYSPVRGKHAKMEQDLVFYAKFVGADDPETTVKALAHFQQAGFKTNTFPSASIGEIAKLVETTWLGVLVGWAQEVERIAAMYNAKYDDVNAFVREIDFLPNHIFPGVIGGHCVMPNIAILRSVLQSDFLDAVVRSNEHKVTWAGLAASEGGTE